MPSLIQALTKGVSNYRQGMSGLIGELSKGEGTGGVGAGTVVSRLALMIAAPHLGIGLAAAREYDRQRDAEFRASRTEQLSQLLQARGMAPKLAGRIARLIMTGGMTSEDSRFTDEDYVQWQAAAWREPDLVPYHPLVSRYVEGEKYNSGTPW